MRFPSARSQYLVGDVATAAMACMAVYVVSKRGPKFKFITELATLCLIGAGEAKIELLARNRPVVGARCLGTFTLFVTAIAISHLKAGWKGFCALEVRPVYFGLARASFVAGYLGPKAVTLGSCALKVWQQPPPDRGTAEQRKELVEEMHSSIDELEKSLQSTDAQLWSLYIEDPLRAKALFFVSRAQHRAEFARLKGRPLWSLDLKDMAYLAYRLNGVQGCISSIYDPGSLFHSDYVDSSLKPEERRKYALGSVVYGSVEKTEQDQLRRALVSLASKEQQQSKERSEEIGGELVAASLERVGIRTGVEYCQRLAREDVEYGDSSAVISWLQKLEPVEPKQSQLSTSTPAPQAAVASSATRVPKWLLQGGKLALDLSCCYFAITWAPKAAVVGGALGLVIGSSKITLPGGQGPEGSFAIRITEIYLNILLNGGASDIGELKSRSIQEFVLETARESGSFYFLTSWPIVGGFAFGRKVGATIRPWV